MKNYLTKMKINGVSWCISNELSAQNVVSRNYLINRLKVVDKIDFYGLTKLQKVKENKYEIRESGADTDFALMKFGRRKYCGFTNILDEAGGVFDSFVKVADCSSIILKLKHLFVSSKAEREFQLSSMIEKRGIPAVFAIAFGEKRRFGFLQRSYLIVKKIEKSLNLQEFFSDSSYSGMERRTVLELFGKTARLSHDQGVFQTDFALNNFMVQKLNANNFKVYLIDYERTKILREINQGKRFWSISKLNRFCVDFSVKDKFRFLKGYYSQELQPSGKFDESLHIRELVKRLERETLRLLRGSARDAMEACVNSERKFAFYKGSDYEGHFLKRYGKGMLIDNIKMFDDSKDITDVAFNGLSIKSVSTGINRERNGEVVFKIYKFCGVNSKQPYRVWQNSNALLKGRVKVLLPVGMIVKNADSFLVLSCNSKITDIAAYFKELNSIEQRLLFLNKLAKFLHRLHSVGRFFSELSSNDVVIRTKDKNDELYFQHTYNFVFNTSLTHDERLNDVTRIVDYLNKTVSSDETAVFKEIYKKYEAWYFGD